MEGPPLFIFYREARSYCKNKNGELGLGVSLRRILQFRLCARRELLDLLITCVRTVEQQDGQKSDVGVVWGWRQRHSSCPSKEEKRRQQEKL